MHIFVIKGARPQILELHNANVFCSDQRPSWEGTPIYLLPFLKYGQQTEQKSVVDKQKRKIPPPGLCWDGVVNRKGPNHACQFIWVSLSGSGLGLTNDQRVRAFLYQLGLGLGLGL